MYKKNSQKLHEKLFYIFKVSNELNRRDINFLRKE